MTSCVNVVYYECRKELGFVVGIGIHETLKMSCLRACGFDSRRSHFERGEMAYILALMLASCITDNDKDGELVDSLSFVDSEIPYVEPPVFDTAPSVMDSSVVEFEECVITGQNITIGLSHQTIFDYKIQIEGCISSLELEVVVVFYGENYAGDVVCGEAVVFNSVATQPSVPCSWCDFGHDVDFAPIYTNLFPRCPGFSIDDNWWDGIGYNQGSSLLLMGDYSHHDLWDAIPVNETQELFKNNAVHFTFVE